MVESRSDKTGRIPCALPHGEPWTKRVAQLHTWLFVRRLLRSATAAAFPGPPLGVCDDLRQILLSKDAAVHRISCYNLLETLGRKLEMLRRMSSGAVQHPDAWENKGASESDLDLGRLQCDLEEGTPLHGSRHADATALLHVD